MSSSRLMDLAAKLPLFNCVQKALSTNLKYRNEWKKWKAWEFDAFDCNSFPVSLVNVSLYLRNKIDSCKTPALIIAVLYGIRWAHELAGVPLNSYRPLTCKANSLIV